jgi:hypothetical protein
MSRRRSWQKASGSSGTTTVVLGAIGECAGTRARTADPRSTVRRRRSRWTSVLDCCAALANLHRRRVHAGDIPTVAQHLANAHTGVRRSTALKLTPIPHPRSGTINFVRSARDDIRTQLVGRNARDRLGQEPLCRGQAHRDEGPGGPQGRRTSLHGPGSPRAGLRKQLTGFSGRWRVCPCFVIGAAPGR